MADIFDQAGQQFNVDPNLLRAQMQVESGGSNSAVSPQGAQGPMQIMPATAKSLGVANPFDRTQAVMGAAKLMAENLDRYGDPATAVMAYHGGTNPANWGPKTQAYLQKVQSAYGGANVPQSNQLPGLPPMGDSSAPQQQMVDPFAGLPGTQKALAAAPAPQQAQGMVDPFAGLPGASSQASAPAAAQTPAQSAPQASGLASFGAGLGHGFGSAVLGAQQLIGHGAQAAGLKTVGDWLTNDAEQGIKSIDSQYHPYAQANPIRAGIGDIGGNVAATAPLAMLAPEFAGAGLGTKVASGAALGAANAAVTPVQQLQPGQTFAGQKLGQIAGGALVGGVAAPVTSAIGNAIAGAGGAAQRQLANAGVNMTPGQILGGGFARTEDKLTSVPVLGDLIKNAQQRSVQGFNTATYNQVLAPLGQKYSGPVGNDGVAAVQKTIGDAYDSALSNMTFRATDPQFQSSITNLAGMANNLPQAQQQTFKNVLQTQIFGKLGPQGTMDGPTLKGVQSELSNTARGYLSDPSFDNRQLGQAIGEIKNAIDASLPNYNAPDAVQSLAKANAAYANFVRLRAAAGSQGAMNNGGVFTAAQLNNAVRSSDKSVGKGATATGNALMQDFSTAGQSVLGSKYPDSGTAGRSMLGLAAGAAAGHAFLPPGVMAPAAIGVGAAALPYTTYGQKLAQALLMNRPTGAQAIGQGVSNYLAPLAPAFGASILNGPSR